MRKNIILISLIFFLTSCGFSPIYVKNNNAFFSIENIDYSGDKELNSFLKMNLNQYKNKNSDKKFFIKAISEYEKVILTKDESGKITNYKLIAKVTFLIEETNQKISFEEEKIIKIIDDKFEEARKERLEKQNFASSISNKLTSELAIN
tara:strand:+ start:236 stop:682 length:447 start_codon:yes stop_codon:yes gene_type:complete